MTAPGVEVEVRGEVNSKALAEAALAVAMQRRQQQEEIRLALLRGDDAAALKLMRKFLGFDDAQESDRTDSRLQ